MKQQRKKIRKGFTLYLVIVAMALTGSSLFLLTHISNGMAYRSDRMYLKACQRNLLASGLIWVKRNTQKIDELPSNESRVLDTTDLQIADSHINVSRGSSGDDSHKDKKLTIEVRCSKRKISMRQKTIVSL
jgi:type VI protein secretion system component VasA